MDALETHVTRLRAELLAGTVQLGDYHQFVIHDPKERVITAPCFRERVLHHAIMNVCEPIFERRLIDDTFACRRGRGRLVALDRTTHFSGRFENFLKLDVKKFFDSIPHQVLIDRLSSLIKDPRLLSLFGNIVGCYRKELGFGLPIGSLTSQHFANFYLESFDRFVKEQRRVKGYVRYMDDMVLWSNSREELRDLAAKSAHFLRTTLHLRLNRVHMNRSTHGVDFLGCRVYENRMTLSHRSRSRFARKLRHLELQLLRGQITELEIQQRATAMLAFTRTPGIESWKFRSQVLQQMPVSGHKARTG
jgi:retron-type reverse transcriptase